MAIPPRIKLSKGTEASIMKLSVILPFEKSTKNTHKFALPADQHSAAPIREIYIKKSVMTAPLPFIRLTVESCETSNAQE